LCNQSLAWNLNSLFAADGIRLAAYSHTFGCGSKAVQTLKVWPNSGSKEKFPLGGVAEHVSALGFVKMTQHSTQPTMERPVVTEVSAAKLSLKAGLLRLTIIGYVLFFRP
jgi:hypothetical protein